MPRIRRIALIAMMTALICVCSWLTIPFTIPFTMQTFAVFSALLLLGGKDGTAAIGLYILIGMAGIPVFSGFRAGIGHLLGPTGGYVIGFLLTGVVFALFEPIFKARPGARPLALSLGLLLCYTAGTIWFVSVYKNHGTQYDILSAASICVFPYIIPDAIKMLLAFIISDKVQKHIHADK